MKANKRLLLGAVALLGLAAVGAPETTPLVASAADVETTATVSNYNVMFGGGDYGDAVAINIDTTDDFSVWFGSGGPTITPVAPYATMYDGYGTPSEITTGAYPFGNKVLVSFGNINRYGSILHIPEGAGYTSNISGNTYKLEESWWVCDLPNGEFGAWRTFVAPTALSFTEDAFELKVGQTLDLSELVDIETTDTDPVFVYQSSDESKVAVTNDGLITGAGEGTATVTVYSGLLKDTIEVDVKAGSPQTGIAIANLGEDNVYQTYVGVEKDFSDIEVVSTYEDGYTGYVPFDPSTDITGTYDFNVAGEYPLTITIGEFSTTFTLKVEQLDAEFAMDASNTFGATSSVLQWGMKFGLIMNDGTQNMNLRGEALENVLSHVTVNGSHDVFTSVKILTTYMMFGTDSSFTGWKVGDVVTLTPGLYSWSYTGSINPNSQEVNGDGNWVATSVLKQNLSFIYNGKEFLVAGVEVKDFAIEYDGGLMIMPGMTYHPSFTFDPITSAGLPTFVSSDPTKLAVDTYGNVTAVDGATAGKATITATLGEIVKTYEFDVTEVMDIKGVSPVGYTHQVYVDQDLDEWEWNPDFNGFQVIYDDGSEEGLLFPLVHPTNEFTWTASRDFEHSTVGTTETSLTVTYEEKQYTCTIPVEVYELYDQEYTTCSVVGWFTYWMFVDAPNTASNVPNIAGTVGTDWTAKYMSPFIHYTRADGTEVGIKTIYQLGHNTAIEPEFLATPGINDSNFNKGPYYMEGDIITIDAGMPIPRFTGSKIGSGDDGMDLATGEIVVDGYTTKTTQYRFDGTAFSAYMPADGLKATKENIELKVGQNVTAGVERTPEGATTGTITYSSSNESVATVTSAGIVSGKGAGTCTITATLTVDDEVIDTVTINVTVTATETSEPTTSEPTTPSEPAEGLTPAAIGGIVGGCVGGVIVIGLIVWLVIYLRKKKA